MRRVSLVVIAAVAIMLLATVGAGAIAAGASPDSPGQLEPAESDSTALGAHGATADIGLAAAATETSLAIEHRHQTVVEEILATPPSERAAVLDSYLDHLEAELSTMIEADQTAAQRVHENELSTDALVNQAIVTGVSASAYQNSLNNLARLDGDIPDIDLTAVTTAMNSRFGIVSGPVRSVGLTATIDPDRRTTIAVEVSENHLVLTGVDLDRHLREAIRFDRLDAGPTDDFTLADADAIVTDAYPETSATTTLRDLGAGLYLVERISPGGTVRAYVSGVDEAVSAEQHSRWLTNVSLNEAGSVTDLGVTVSLDRGVDSGPIRVTVEDATTGQPVEATVFIRHDGMWTPLGSVDGAGHAWAPDPRGPVDIGVVTGDGVVTISLQR